MDVPFVDLALTYQKHKQEIDGAIEQVLAGQRFIMGPEVLAFESEMATYLDEPVYCIGTSSGTSALFMSLMALQVKEGDEVIVPAYSFIATASIVSLNRAKPVFVDVEPDTLNLDCAQLGERLSDRTRAVIPVHLFGRAVDMDQLSAVLDAAGHRYLPIIEDAAQAVGSAFRRQKLGTWGTLGCFSFFPSKNLGGFGDGGMVVTADPELAEVVSALRTHGGKDRYYNTRLGINGRLDALQAAVLRTRLKHLPDWIDQRRASAAHYRMLFEQAGLPERLRLPPGDGDGRFFHSYNYFNVQVGGGLRDALKETLTAHHIGTAVYYPTPLPLQPCFRSLGHRKGDYPNAEKASNESLALPMYPGLSPQAQEYVVETVVRFFQTR